MTTGIDLSFYEDVNGFLDRFSDKRDAAIMVDTRITTKDTRAREVVLGKLLDLVETISENDLSGTLTFMVLKSLDNDNGIRIFQRFASWEAQSTHARNATVLDFWLGSKEEIAGMESQTYVPTSNGWLRRDS